MRHVKFSPEEMAYEIPADTSDWVPVGRGPGAIFNKPAKGAAKVVELDADVAKVFKDAAEVNNALRKLIEAVPSAATRGRKRSA